MIAGAVAFVGVIGWSAMIRKVEPLDWAAKAGSSPPVLR
jgi:hypothetical protein